MNARTWSRFTMCAMDAREALRIEPLLEATQREVQRVARALGVGDHIVAVGFEPPNLLRPAAERGCPRSARVPSVPFLITGSIVPLMPAHTAST